MVSFIIYHNALLFMSMLSKSKSICGIDLKIKGNLGILFGFVV